MMTFPIWLNKVSKTEACQSMSATLTGFLLMAPPTARAALGFPAISARRLYETVSPNFTSLRSTCSTRLVNASSPQKRREDGEGRKSERQKEENRGERESSSFNQTAAWDDDDINVLTNQHISWFLCFEINCFEFKSKVCILIVSNHMFEVHSSFLEDFLFFLYNPH